MNAAIARDPLPAIAVRLGTPHGEAFLTDNRSAVSEIHGEAVEAALCAAVFEHDIAKAREFAELLVPNSTFDETVLENGAEVQYRLDGAEISGRLKIHPMVECSAVALAIVEAAVSIHERLHRREPQQVPVA